MASSTDYIGWGSGPWGRDNWGSSTTTIFVDGVCWLRGIGVATVTITGVGQTGWYVHRQLAATG
jgi:hypothetical protein